MSLFIYIHDINKSSFTIGTLIIPINVVENSPENFDIRLSILSILILIELLFDKLRMLIIILCLLYSLYLLKFDLNLFI